MLLIIFIIIIFLYYFIIIKVEYLLGNCRYILGIFLVYSNRHALPIGIVIESCRHIENCSLSLSN